MDQQVNTNSNDTLAMIIEGVFGFFGFLGIGWMYAGNVGTGILALIGMWVFIAIETTISFFTGGIAMCLLGPLHIVIIVFSAIKARDYARESVTDGKISVILFAILGIVLCCVISVILIFALSIPVFDVFQDAVNGLN